MHILIQKLTGGESVSIEVEPYYSISYVKVQIQYKLEIPADEIQLRFDNKTLQDEHKLSDYKIENGSKVYFEQQSDRGIGGSNFGTAFVDLTDEKGLKRAEWSISAPKWRQAKRGLCLEGICTNESCRAFSQTVIMGIGYKKFDMLADVNEITCKCPICPQYVEPQTCGFNNCWWRWHGVKQEGKGKPPKQYSGDWKYADNAYHYFDEKLSGTVIWKQLIVEVVEKKPF